METINLAVLDLEKKLAPALGKKGTASDFTIYNFRSEAGVLVTYEPTSYPEKLQPLLYSLWLADCVLLKVGQIDKYFGECLIALECSGKPGFVITDEEDKFRTMTKGMAVNGYQRIGENADEIKTALFAMERKTPNSKHVEHNSAKAIAAGDSTERIGARAIAAGDSKTRIRIDHYFDVKGVGLVALGKVESGKVEVHDELVLLPQGKAVGIKSIQVQDKDVKECETLGRVGLCLKGVELKDLEKGNILVAKESQSEFMVSDSVELDCAVSRFVKKGIEKDGVYFLSAGMQFLSCRALGGVAPGSRGKCAFVLEKKIVLAKGERAMVCDPNGMPRGIGFGIV